MSNCTAFDSFCPQATKSVTDSRRRSTEDQTRADNIKIIVCQELFRQYLIEPNRSNATLVGGRWNQNCAIATQRKIDEGVWLAWSLNFSYILFSIVESISQRCFYFSSTQRPRGGGGGKIITSCCQNFPPNSVNYSIFLL